MRHSTPDRLEQPGETGTRQAHNLEIPRSTRGAATIGKVPMALQNCRRRILVMGHGRP